MSQNPSEEHKRKRTGSQSPPSEPAFELDEETEELLPHKVPSINILPEISEIKAEDIEKGPHATRSSKSWFSDDESKIKKLILREETIFKKTQYPDHIELVFNVGVIYNLLFLLALVYQSVICALLISFYAVASDNLTQLFIFLMIANLVKVIISTVIVLFYNMLVREYQRYIRIDLMSSATYVVIYIGVVLYLTEQIEARHIWIFALPQLLIDFFFYACLNKPISLAEKIASILKTLESAQNLLLLLNIGVIHSSNWALVMCFYYAEAFLLIVLSGIAAICTVVGVSAWLVRFRTMLNDYVIPLYLLSFFVYSSGVGFFLFFAFLGVLRLFNRGTLLFPNPNKEDMDPMLYRVAISMLVFCVLIFFWNFVFAILALKRIKRYISYSTKETKYYEYTKSLRLTAKLISEHFFKKKSKLKSEEANKDRLLEKCFICYKNDANIIIFPCGHTGFCLDCLLADQSKRNTCMICRKAISKAKVLSYDPEIQEYVAKGEVKFFENITNAAVFLRN